MLEMDDPVKVEYEQIEQLFCQKVVDTSKKTEQPKQAKAKTEVRRFYIAHNSYFHD